MEACKPQVHWDGWYEQLGGDDSPLADAILDRIIYDAYRIHIQSTDPKHDKSMREVYGLDKWLNMLRTGGSSNAGQAALPHRNIH